MNWDDLRFVLALHEAGTLARAARALKVDHTTVSRRIEALETVLAVRLFTRAPTGYVATAEAERLLPEMRKVEASVHALQRGAFAEHGAFEGSVRVTAPETFGGCYLASRLAAFGLQHPALCIELVTGGEVLDLARREAEIALRFFRSQHANLVVRKAAVCGSGLYASEAYLQRAPWHSANGLATHPILTARADPGVVEAAWVAELAPNVRPAFVANLTVSLLEAVRAGRGVGVLPRYLGDAEPSLRYLPAPREPREVLWVTVHEDVQHTPRVRAVLDFLAATLSRDRALLLGREKRRPEGSKPSAEID